MVDAVLIVKIETGRALCTLKEEFTQHLEWRSPFELEKEIKAGVECIWKSYRHSSLGYKIPTEF